MRDFTTFAITGLLFLAGSASLFGVTPDGRAFSSPDAAAQALLAAAKSGDQAEVIAVLGPSAKRILFTRDSVADQRMQQRFAARASEKMKLTDNPKVPGAKTLLIGKNEWPLPIPLIRVDDQWYFDVKSGKEEILDRRIGGNELDAIEISRGYVEAQNEYAEKNRTDNGPPHYAQKIISTPGTHDGLYWPSNGAADESPMGSTIAKALAEGYTSKKAPYHGYYFRILAAQGPHASGGAMSYLDNGVMTKGFALIAWPSDYRSTGVMTFVVNKAGIVYQKDLGRDTSKIASGSTTYDPDETWQPVAATPGP